ncbi:MAG: hypothetical protein ACYC91_01330 [Solirubrobacteraceae bacterium]
MPVRVPLNAFDELMLHLDPAFEPASVWLEVRVSGRLDADRLAVAARSATALHPLARARLAGSRFSDRQYFWEISDSADHVPLEIVSCPDEESLDRARSRLMSIRRDLGSPPPFALMLAHRPRGDQLMIQLNHAAGDGISAFRLLTSIARAYAAVDDPVPDVDPLEFRGRGPESAPGAVDGAPSRLAKLGALVSSVRSGRRPAVVSVSGDESQPEGYHLLTIRLERAELERAKAIRLTTVNDLLIAAVAVAVRRFNDVRGITPAPVSLVMPLNLRPEQWANEVFSNIVAMVPVTVAPEEQTDLASAQLAVAGRTAAVKLLHPPGRPVPIPAGSGIFRVGVRRWAALARKLPDIVRTPQTAIVTNLGVVDPLDFGHEAGKTIEIWLSAPPHKPLGLGLAATTMSGEMFITLRTSGRRQSRQDVVAFAEVLRGVLQGR